MVLRNVVLPQPDGPMNETNSPFSISRLTSDSATTSPSPVEKVRPRFLAETTEAVEDVMGYTASASNRVGGQARNGPHSSRPSNCTPKPSLP